MDVITIESGLWQELTDRIKKIESYVEESTKSGWITPRLSACSVSAEGRYSSIVRTEN